MTDKHKDAAATAAYINGYDLGIADGRRIRDIQQNRIDELEAALDNILSCHRNAMMDPRLFSALIPDFVLEEAYGVRSEEHTSELQSH